MRPQWPSIDARPEDLVVIVGAGELGPFGTRRVAHWRDIPADAPLKIGTTAAFAPPRGPLVGQRIGQKVDEGAGLGVDLGYVVVRAIDFKRRAKIRRPVLPGEPGCFVFNSCWRLSIKRWRPV